VPVTVIKSRPHWRQNVAGRQIVSGPGDILYRRRQIAAAWTSHNSIYVSRSLIGRIHGAIVAAIVAATGRSDRLGDDRRVYTLQATGRRNDRQLVARLDMFTWCIHGAIVAATVASCIHYTGDRSARRSLRQSRRRSPVYTPYNDTVLWYLWHCCSQDAWNLICMFGLSFFQLLRCLCTFKNVYMICLPFKNSARTCFMEPFLFRFPFLFYVHLTIHTEFIAHLRLDSRIAEYNFKSSIKK